MGVFFVELQSHVGCRRECCYCLIMYIIPVQDWQTITQCMLGLAPAQQP